MSKEYLIILFVVLFAGCEKPPVESIDPCDPLPCDTTKLMGKLDTVWTKKIIEGNTYAINRSLLLHGNSLIDTFVLPDGSVIKSFDLSQNGKEQWLWNDLNDDYVSTFVSEDKNLVLNKTWAHRSSIDFLGGHTIELVKSNKRSGPRGILLGDHIYYDEKNENEDEVWIMRAPVNNLVQIDTIYYLNNETITNRKKSIESYNLWVHPQTKDSILIFQHRMALPDRVDVVAWNMTKEEIAWQHDDLTRLGNSNHQQIFMMNDKAYFSGGTAFYCFDMSTGNIVWEYEQSSGTNSFGFYRTIYALKENKLIVKDAGANLFAFDPQTGNLAWVKNDTGISSVSAGSPAYHDGIIYYTMEGKLWAVQASNGIVLWSERSSRIPMGETSFGGEVAIDTLGRVLYATDDNELFAIKLYGD